LHRTRQLARFVYSSNSLAFSRINLFSERQKKTLAKAERAFRKFVRRPSNLWANDSETTTNHALIICLNCLGWAI